jgi:hypothetical protein
VPRILPYYMQAGHTALDVAVNADIGDFLRDTIKERKNKEIPKSAE